MLKRIARVAMLMFMVTGIIAVMAVAAGLIAGVPLNPRLAAWGLPQVPVAAAAAAEESPAWRPVTASQAELDAAPEAAAALAAEKATVAQANAGAAKKPEPAASAAPVSKNVPAGAKGITKPIERIAMVDTDKPGKDKSKNDNGKKDKPKNDKAGNGKNGNGAGNGNNGTETGTETKTGTGTGIETKTETETGTETKTGTGTGNETKTGTETEAGTKTETGTDGKSPSIPLGGEAGTGSVEVVNPEVPTANPTPSGEPSEEPTGEPAGEPTVEPTDEPTPVVPVQPEGYVVPTTGPDCTQVKCVALTFDDGPNREFTPGVLDTLKKHDGKATFFMLGGNVAGNEDIVKRVVAEGSEVGIHTWSHPQLSTLKPAEVEKEIVSTRDVLVPLTGSHINWLRAPYGDLGGDAQPVTKELGLPAAFWDVDSLDWEDQDPEVSKKRILDQVKPGSIVLMHDVHPYAPALLPSLMEELAADGYHFVTVSELLAGKDIYAGGGYTHSGGYQGK